MSPEQTAIFEKLYREHRRDIRAYIARRVPRRDMEDVEQRIWTDVAEALTRCEPSSYKAFIYTITVRKLMDYRKCRYNSEALLGLLDEAEDHTDSTEAALSRKKLLALILPRLDAEEREAMKALYVDDAPQTQIANELGLTDHHWRSLFRSMRKKLDIGARQYRPRDGGRAYGVLLFLRDMWREGRERVRPHALRAGLGLAGACSVALTPSAVSLAGDQPHVLVAAPSSSAPSSPATSSSAPSSSLPATSSSPASSAQAARAVSPGEAERRSLRRIRALGAKDPAAGLAALAWHRKVFRFERYGDERADIESDLRARLAAKIQRSDAR